MAKYLCCFLFAMATFFCGSAQPSCKKYAFSSLNVDDGLSQNSVWDVLQTRDGFLWIANSDGINRYGGGSCKVYRHEDGNTSSISGQNLPRLYEDRKGTLWVSDDHGISI